MVERIAKASKLPSTFQTIVSEIDVRTKED